MASSIKRISIVFITIFFSSNLGLHISSTNSLSPNLTSIQSICQSTPYPDSCFDSLKLSISINISPDILTYLLQTLHTALSEATKLTNLFSNGGNSNDIVEKQRGTLQDCKELHETTLSILEKTVSSIKDGDSKKLADARVYLSAALTNKNTCLEGLDSALGPLKPVMVKSLIGTYKHVSNSLSMLPKLGKQHRNRVDDKYDPREVVTVAVDGTGNFSTIGDAIRFAPNKSKERVMIYVREGVYEENVVIPSCKTNIVLIGDGSDVTFITGNRSVVDGWTTFRSATLAVSGEGFLARDITIENRAGPEKHQAAALRVSADLAAFYRCTINGYQDTLYVHSFRQFYRECNISGTTDYIFGNAAAVFQACNIISRMPMPDTLDQYTGISIQNCSILATNELYRNSNNVKSYLGRPWRLYSTAVFLESYIDDFIDPNGWRKWSSDEGLDTLYYGEHNNYGPGSVTDDRVAWPGYHIMDYESAYDFAVSEFITGEAWLDSTWIPYDYVYIIVMSDENLADKPIKAFFTFTGQIHVDVESCLLVGSSFQSINL
ncbi:Plant invertase/pectin methylesterase inhibitor superfamily [Gossypium australe]|uniref:Pectinesterase n=1 Tax=Gossypium australe TaxID=47621 RepID=A0A5B6WW85_9ROSI|nr:Plant invertase/pectin methylesterase inhibitor superfamily [Gossypium australe]